MQKICSVSTSNKSPKYFFKNFHIFINFSQNLKKIFLNFARNPPSPITSRNFFKIFFKFFLQSSLSKLLILFYFKSSLITFYQTFRTKFTKISPEVSVILSNFSQNLSRVPSILKESSEFF